MFSSPAVTSLVMRRPFKTCPLKVDTILTTKYDHESCTELLQKPVVPGNWPRLHRRSSSFSTAKSSFFSIHPHCALQYQPTGAIKGW